MRILRPPTLFFALLLFFACSEKTVVAPEVSGAEAVRLRCDVDVVAASMTCSSPGVQLQNGSSADLIVGGQNTYVKLTSSGLSTSSGVLSADVSIQNLTAVAMGTSDGTTPSGNGVRVFFATFPTNGVTIANADGTGTFTASGQPYFQYAGALLGGDGVLSSSETSALKLWQFNLNGATTFSFTVYVSTPMPVEGGVLRWQLITQDTSRANFLGMWAAGPNDVMVTSSDSSLLRYDGDGWFLFARTPVAPEAVWYTSSTDVWIVGEHVASHYDGTTWSSTDFGNHTIDVWGTSPNNVYVVGQMGVRHWDGTSWNIESTPPQAIGWNAIWGSSPSDIFIVGDSGKIAHFDGTSWTAMTSGTSQKWTSVWGSSSTNVYAVGVAGRILRYNGVSWNIAQGSSEIFEDVWVAPTGQVFAVSSNAIYQFDGSSWSFRLREDWAAVTGTSASNVFISGPRATIRHLDSNGWNWQHGSLSIDQFWAASDGDITATTTDGQIIHYNGRAWLGQLNAGAAFEMVWGVSPTNVYASTGAALWHYDGASWTDLGISGVLAMWGPAANDIFAVGQNGSIRHFDGTSWVPMTSPTTDYLFGVWGSSSTDIFAVGFSGTVIHYDGTTWSVQSSGTGVMLAAVSGTGPNDVFAVGASGTIIHYDGTNWSPMTSGTTIDLTSVTAVTPQLAYAVGYKSGIRQYNGTSWSTTTANASNKIRFLHALSAADVLAAGDGVTLIRGSR